MQSSRRRFLQASAMAAAPPRPGETCWPSFLDHRSGAHPHCSTAPAARPQVLLLSVDMISPDHWLSGRAPAQSLHLPALRGFGEGRYPCTFHPSAGAHTWINWREYLVETLPLLFRRSANPNVTFPMHIPKSRILSALFCTALALSAGATTPSVEHAPKGTDYSLRWGTAAQISDVTFSLRVNGEWIYGDAFPRRVWSSENGRQVLRCSGLPPLEEFVLTIETATNRPYAVVKAELKARDKFELGGVRVLTKKGEAPNLTVTKADKNWTIFAEALHAPDHGRIFTIEQITGLKAAKKADPRNAFYAAIVARLPHLLCSRSGPDHLNCYGQSSPLSAAKAYVWFFVSFWRVETQRHQRGSPIRGAAASCKSA